MKNIVIEILNNSERIKGEINFLVNTSGLEIGSDKAKVFRERLEKTIKNAQQDVLDIHEKCVFEDEV